MDKFFFILKALVETVGIVIFIAVAVFAVLAGMLYQFFTGAKDRGQEESPIIPPVAPPISTEAETKADKAGDSVSMKPGQDSVGFFNDLAKP